MIAKSKSQLVSIAFVFVLFIVIIIVRGIDDNRQYEVKMEFLELLSIIEGSDIEKLVISDEVGFETENVLNTEITDLSELDVFAKCLNSTILWKPNHPLIGQSFDFQIVLKNGITHVLNVNLLWSRDKNVYIYYYGNNANARFQNTEIYIWLDRNGFIKDI